MELLETGCDPRVKRLARAMRAAPAVCTERAWFMTESYKKTEGESFVIRKAKALAEVLSNVSIRIDPDELIVGCATAKQRGAAILPEVNAGWLLNEMDSLSTRQRDVFLPLSADEQATIRKLLPYWQGKSLFDRWQARIPEAELKHMYDGAIGGGSFCANGHYAGHLAVDFAMVLAKGTSGIQREIAERLKALDPSDPGQSSQREFLRAAWMALDAAPRFAARYADLARELAAKESDDRRRAELERIAAACSQVPGLPARDFFEALQSAYFIWLILMLEGWGYGMSFGRPDQYLYPFYQQDLKQGRIKPEEARTLIDLLYIKVNSVVTVTDGMTAIAFNGFPQVINFTLGGLTREGNDAVNELSYLFVEADQDVAMSQNDLCIRIHSLTPEAFVTKACDTARLLKGKFKFISDETAIRLMVADGYPVEHARDYAITGCNSPTVPGYSLDGPGGMFNLPLMLELALNDGRSRLSGEQIGPNTGDAANFTSYEQVFEAYKKQVEALLPVAAHYKNTDKDVYAEFAPTPFLSSLFHGPVEKGLDVGNGGTAPYARLAVSIAGAPNVGDSLAAIKKAVFEEKKIGMGELLEALERNFEGCDRVLHALSRAPKFGNDDDYVDSIVDEVLAHAHEQVAKIPGARGVKLNIAAAAVTANVPLGQAVGALPDGRKSGLPLSEGGISPYQGRNVLGPVATMRSVAKLTHENFTNGSVLNMRFSPGALKDGASLKKFVSLVRTFCETGGFLVQFNIVDTETLRAAQKDPGKYRDLLVRVATYSSYFVELSPELQEDVIARMEFHDL